MVDLSIGLVTAPHINLLKKPVIVLSTRAIDTCSLMRQEQWRYIWDGDHDVCMLQVNLNHHPRRVRGRNSEGALPTAGGETAWNEQDEKRVWQMESAHN